MSRLRCRLEGRLGWGKGTMHYTRSLISQLPRGEALLMGTFLGTSRLAHGRSTQHTHRYSYGGSSDVVSRCHHCSNLFINFSGNNMDGVWNMLRVRIDSDNHSCAILWRKTLSASQIDGPVIKLNKNRQNDYHEGKTAYLLWPRITSYYVQWFSDAYSLHGNSNSRPN